MVLTGAVRRSLHGSCRSGRLPAGTFFGVLVCAWRPNIQALHWQRFPLPGQWAGLPTGASAAGGRRARPEPVAVQLPAVVVETRPLEVSAALAEATPSTTVANVSNVGPLGHVAAVATATATRAGAATGTAGRLVGSTERGPCQRLHRLAIS